MVCFYLTYLSVSLKNLKICSFVKLTSVLFLLYQSRGNWLYLSRFNARSYKTIDWERNNWHSACNDAREFKGMGSYVYVSQASNSSYVLVFCGFLFFLTSAVSFHNCLYLFSNQCSKSSTWLIGYIFSVMLVFLNFYSQVSCFVMRLDDN